MKRIILHTLILIAITFIANANSYAQKIEVSVDRDSILIGEAIQLSISYPIEKSTSSLQFFEGDSIGNGFEVLEVLKNDTIENQKRLKLSLTNFELDYKVIPPFTVFYGENKLISRPISVHVSLMEVDTTQPIKDIKPILKDPFTASDYFKMGWKWVKNNWWIVVLGLIVIGFILWLLLRKKQPKEVKIIEKPIVPAHILANEKLKILQEKRLWQNGNQKEYNVELTEIIQFYITERYNVPTAEKTSSEILHSLRFVEMGEENKQNLKKLLILSDLVKFAKEKPTSEENESVLNDAYKFVETTKNELN
ncbi:MAG: LPXTG cell wall anchor domain-containing protein [Flavobacteriales bacterium]|jgi:LPXTG-motif cell wall-anchored protein